MNSWARTDGRLDALASEKQILAVQEDGDSTLLQCHLVHSRHPNSCCKMQHSVQDTKRYHLSLIGARIGGD